MISIVAGNWKMNGSKQELNQWFEDFFKNAVEFEKTNTNTKLPSVLICVPSIFIDYAKNLAYKYNAKTKSVKVSVGAQDCHFEDKGAFTGNTSAVFLKEFGCQYCIVGHSERREYHFENNNVVAKKAINSLKNGITPIVCVGEVLKVREEKRHLEFIQQQVLETFEGVDVKNVIIAYEPVWGIGTGKVCSNDDIQEMNNYIRKVISTKMNVAIDNIKVLYGASVKSSNVAEIAKLKSVDGVLVGGASLKGEEFFNIVKNSLI